MDFRADHRRTVWRRLVVAASRRSTCPCSSCAARRCSPAAVLAAAGHRYSTAIPKTPTNGAHFREIDVCGVGRVKLESDDWTAAGDYVNALTRNSRLRWLSALRGSGDSRARATGLYLDGFEPVSPRKDSGAARDELVQLALDTQDPAVFALAHAKCRGSTGESASQGACPQLSLDDWTRADSDNAVPWLERALEAHQEKDAAAEAAAFAHAAQAHRYETYNWSYTPSRRPRSPRM